MGCKSDGKADHSHGTVIRPKADRSVKQTKKNTKDLEIDEIRPDPKIATRVTYNPNKNRRW